MKFHGSRISTTQCCAEPGSDQHTARLQGSARIWGDCSSKNNVFAALLPLSEKPRKGGDVVQSMRGEGRVHEACESSPEFPCTASPSHPCTGYDPRQNVRLESTSRTSCEDLLHIILRGTALAMSCIGLLDRYAERKA
jgi:hypothetical protein